LKDRAPESLKQEEEHMINKLYLGLFACMVTLVAVKIIVMLGQPTLTNAEGLKTSPLVQVGSGFLYQGRLTNGGAPAGGPHDFTFKLFDAATGGNQVGTTLTVTNQTVNNGLFTVSLDFGNTAFLGDARWLEMAVRVSGNGAFTTISPRQSLLPVPYALNAPWFGTGGKPYPYNPLRQVNATAVFTDNNSFGDPDEVTIGSDGLPIFSYYDETTGAVGLKIVHCEDLLCGDNTTSTVFSGALSINYVSMTTGSDGFAILSWYELNSSHLNLAHCNNILCTSSTVTTLDTAPGLPRIAIGTDGFPLIADGSSTTLKVFHCTNATCSAFSVSGSLDTVGSGPSITIGGDGLGLISYENSNGQLKVAHCTNATCTSATASLLDNTFGGGGLTSIATGADGLGLISYDPDGFSNNDHLKAVHCSNVTCTAATVSTLDTVSDVGWGSSIAISPDGLGIISYSDNNFHHFKLANCNNVACTSASVINLDNTANADGTTSITWGVDGLPVITYHLGFNPPYETVFLHCGSPTCVNDFHAR